MKLRKILLIPVVALMFALTLFTGESLKVNACEANEDSNIVIEVLDTEDNNISLENEEDEPDASTNALPVVVVKDDNPEDVTLLSIENEKNRE